MNLLRPRRLITLIARNRFNRTQTLLGKTGGKAARSIRTQKVTGFDKMLLDKLNFFHLTGNIFTLYCILKASGWALTVLERKKNKKFEEQVIAEAAYIEIPSDTTYSDYLDAYTLELGASLPIIFLLGTLVNKRFGSVYSLKLFAASWLLGYGLNYSKTTVGLDTKEKSPASTIAAALVAHSLFRFGIPFYGSAA